MYGISSQGRTAAAMTDLFKGVINTAHAAGQQGVDEAQALAEFRRHGAAEEGFPSFLGCMTSAGLIERDAQRRLHPTAHGLAYAGIDPRKH